jgi:hypothetical protein
MINASISEAGITKNYSAIVEFILQKGIMNLATESVKHRLNIELDLRSLFGLPVLS